MTTRVRAQVTSHKSQVDPSCFLIYLITVIVTLWSDPSTTTTHDASPGKHLPLRAGRPDPTRPTFHPQRVPPDPGRSLRTANGQGAGNHAQTLRLNGGYRGPRPSCTCCRNGIISGGQPQATQARASAAIIHATPTVAGVVCRLTDECPVRFAEMVVIVPRRFVP